MSVVYKYSWWPSEYCVRLPEHRAHALVTEIQTHPQIEYARLENYEYRSQKTKL